MVQFLQFFEKLFEKTNFTEIGLKQFLLGSNTEL